MSGSSGTMVQKRTGELDRSDFVCVPREWERSHVKARVDASISTGHSAIDHFAVRVDAKIVCQATGFSRRCGRRFNVASWNKPEVRDAIARGLLQIPQRSWSTNVHDHATQLVSDIQKVLHGAEESKQKYMRNDFFSDATTSLHVSLRSARSRLKGRLTALRLTRIRCAFIVWRSRGICGALEEVFTGGWLSDLFGGFDVGA